MAETEAQDAYHEEAPAAADAADVEDHGQALRAYVLYPYRAARLEAPRLQHGVKRSAAEARRGRARPLRRCLASLARRASWQAFLEHYEAAVADACARVSANARVALGETAELAAAVRERWLTAIACPASASRRFNGLGRRGR